MRAGKVPETSGSVLHRYSECEAPRRIVHQNMMTAPNKLDTVLVRKR